MSGCATSWASTGANVPRSVLPAWMRAVGEVLPLTHAITGTRLAADGGSLASVLPSLGLEAGLGVCYLPAAVVLLHWFEHGSRLKGTLDTL